MREEATSAAEYYVSAVKRETVRGFSKYLIDKAEPLPDGTVGLSATDIVDLTVKFLEGLK